MSNEKIISGGGWTRECTQIAKGVAIILMILHHTLPSSLELPAILSFRFLEEIVTISVLIGRFGKLCVAIFTVLSGYGIACSIRNKAMEGDELSFSLLARVKKMYFTFWKAFAIFAAARVLVGDALFKGGIKIFFMNFFAISSDYCGSWWFLGPYIGLVLLYPFFKSFANRKKASVTTDLFWIFILWTFGAYVYPQLMNHTLMCEYSVSMPIWWLLYWVVQLSASFMTGVVIARADLFFQWKNLFKNRVIYKLTSATIILIVFVARSLHGNVPETRIPEFFYATWFIVGSVGLVKDMPLISRLFCVLGNHSTYMWLLHPIVLYYILPYMPNAIGIIQDILLVVVFSFAMSWLLKKAETFFRQFKQKLLNLIRTSSHL